MSGLHGSAEYPPQMVTTDLDAAAEEWRTQGWTVVHDLVPTAEIDESQLTVLETGIGIDIVTDRFLFTASRVH